MTARLIGLKNQTMDRDDEGHRTYDLTWHYRTDDYLDGPETVLQMVNTLHPVGSAYVEGNDYDPWAFRTPELTIAPHRDIREGDPCADWLVNSKFTTKPMFRCNDTQIENPLLEPVAISGDFVHVSREQKTDRNGKPLLHVNYEPMIGPEVEEKISYPAITLSFNSATLPISLINLLINKVNDAPLWGLPKRCVRFTDCKWERILYGVCFYYFKMTYTFETNFETFDKFIPAVGYKTLLPGSFPFLQGSYAVQKDVLGENEGSVILNSVGGLADPDKPPLIVNGSNVVENPLTGSILGPLIQRREIAKEGNLLLLGIPSTLPT
jgi:hypothetical protein